MVDKQIERAARAVHESYKGKDTWTKATPDERSKARHAVRLVLSTVGAPVPPTPKAGPWATSRW